MSSNVASSPSTHVLEETLKAAKREAADCILKSSWTVTVPSVIVSVPLSVYLRSYTPLVFSACSASGIDYFRGLQKCNGLTEEVKKIQRELAISKLRVSPGEM